MALATTREAWTSRVGVILAVTGSAVGLGNFLRFPGKAAQYEGGAFMIPYFIAFLLLGLPIAWAEWSLGRYGGARGFNSAPGIFRVVWRRRAAPYLGALGMLIPVAIYMYYVYIEAWCLGYAVKFATGQMAMGGEKGPYVDFFARFVGLNADGAALDLSNGLLSSAVFFLVVCYVLNFVLIYRGLNKGIEWFCRWAMPALMICAIVVLVRVLTLGTPNPALPEQSLSNGLGFMWNPGVEGRSFWTSLGNAQMWLEATGQIFFSLSVGFGIVLCYASYLRKDDDVALGALTASSGNEFCEVALGGLITIPAAFVFLGAAGTAEACRSTFNLGFMTLPMVFASMPLGQFVGAVFFFLLFLAAVTSSLSMLQPAIALIEEGLGLGRRASVTLLGFVTAVGSGFIVYHSRDARALDTVDFWVGTFCIYVLATIQVLLFGWVLGIERGYHELMRGAEIHVPRFVMYVIKYVSPAYLLAIFGVWIFQQASAEKNNYFAAIARDTVSRLSVGMIALVLIFFLLLIAQSVRRWNAAEKGEHGAIS
ncbi:MAG: sodium-dependent transporter [Vicinamibacteria bacterium]|nr:sodium-dependent transporter [Vicinamibacteria bacterium]